jgi:hypothetical protein
MALLRLRYGSKIAELNCTLSLSLGELSRTHDCFSSKAPAPVTTLLAGWCPSALVGPAEVNAIKLSRIRRFFLVR